TGVDEPDGVCDVTGPLEGGGDLVQEDIGGGGPYQDEYSGGRPEVSAEDDRVTLVDEAVDGALDGTCAVEDADVLFKGDSVGIEIVGVDEEEGIGNEEVTGTVVVAVDVVPICVVLGSDAMEELDEVGEHVAIQS
ncbi:hypothetical protein LTS18_004839, partial [Coniosporium uncinatum]